MHKYYVHVHYLRMKLNVQCTSSSKYCSILFYLNNTFATMLKLKDHRNQQIKSIMAEYEPFLDKF